MTSGTNRSTDTLSLADLVGDTATFIREHWNRRAYVHRAHSPDLFSGLFSIAEFDEILANRKLREPYLRITRNGAALREERFMVPLRVQKMPIRGVVDTPRVAHEFSSGATLLLDSIDHYHPRIRELCVHLQAALKAPAEAVAFVTPKDVQGLNVHHDNTEVLVLQVHGTKRWTVYEQIRPLTKAGRALRAEEVGEPILEVVLSPGDTLYIPWGSPHYAVSGDDLSCHVSVMLRPPTWGDMLSDLISKAFPATYDPIPFVEEDLPALAINAEARIANAVSRLRTLDLAESVTELSQSLKPHRPARAGFLRQAALRGTLDAHTRVVRNERTRFTTATAADGAIELKVETRTFRYPAASGPALEAILEMTKPRTVADLCRLPEAAALKLIDHLVGNGILSIMK